MSALDFAARTRGLQNRRLAQIDRLVAALPAQIRARRAMASPPTVTSGTSSAGGTLTRTFWAANYQASYQILSQPYGGHFSYARMKPGEGATRGVYPTGTNAVSGLVLTASTTATRTAAAAQQSFFHSGQIAEIILAHTSTAFMVRVDGEYVSLTPVLTGSTGGAFRYYKLDFGSRGVRRIDVIGNGLVFVGVNVEPGDLVEAAPIRGPRVITIGDSFSQASPTGWASQFADMMGWDDVWQMGVGGTGYIKDAGGASKTFINRLASDVIPYAPDIVIVPAGLNDSDQPGAMVGAAAAAFVAALKCALPNCLIIGGYNASRGVNYLTSGALDAMDAIKNAYLAGGAEWCNPCELPMAYAGGTFPSATINVALSAGRAGNNGTEGMPSASTGLRIGANIGDTAHLRVGSTVEIGSGSTRERKVITGHAQIAGGLQGYAFNGTLQYAHSVGETVREVGPSYLTGTGYVGATTGWGNADTFVGSDGTHPTTDGHTALAAAMAGLMHDRLYALRRALAA